MYPFKGVFHNWKVSKSTWSIGTVEYALLLHDNVKVNVIPGFAELNGFIGEFFSEIRLGETTVQSGLEAIDPQIKAALATFVRDGIRSRCH